MEKHYVCAHCGKINKVDEKDPLDTAGEKAGAIAGRAAITLLATALTAPIGGVGGVVAGALFTAEGVHGYLTLECGNCGKRFFVKRWE